MHFFCVLDRERVPGRADEENVVVFVVLGVEGVMFGLVLAGEQLLPLNHAVLDHRLELLLRHHVDRVSGVCVAVVLGG